MPLRYRLFSLALILSGLVAPAHPQRAGPAAPQAATQGSFQVLDARGGPRGLLCSLRHTDVQVEICGYLALFVVT